MELVDLELLILSSLTPVAPQAAAPCKHEMMPINLEQAILDALHPQGLGERIRLSVTGGLSARQVFHRLPLPLQEELLAGDGNPTTRQREALSKVVKGLFVQIDAHRVYRRRTRIRTSMVDVYRLA